MEVKCEQLGSAVCRTCLSYLPSHLVQFIFLYLWILAEIKVIYFYWVLHCVKPTLHAFPSHPPSFLLCWTKLYVTVKFFVWREVFLLLLWSVSSNTFLKSFCTQCRARLKEGRLWVNTIPGATLHTPRYQVWVCVHSSTHHALKHKVFSLIYKALVVYITCPALYRVVQWPDKAYCTLHLPEKKE